MNAISIALGRSVNANPASPSRHPVVSEQEWLAARLELLAREKEFSHARDQLNRQRLALPWVRITTPYEFDTPHGKRSLADLFEGRSQLIVQHFMFAPEWDAGCLGCSFMAESVDGAVPHLNHHDVSYVAISRAPLEKLLAFRERMGWRFPWVSSCSSDFNYDFHVSFTQAEQQAGEVFYNFRKAPYPGVTEKEGLSAFYKDEDGQVFHTYSTFERGTEGVMSAYYFLDIAPKGRNEGERGNLSHWVRLHDQYEENQAAHGCCASQAAVTPPASATASAEPPDHDCGCGSQHK
jgi:predicted dithiol-disulfide oxidoreductase (DUF899 family)